MKFPLQRLDWNPSDASGRREMQDLGDIVILGIKECMPKHQNIHKAFEITQEKDESPSAFLQQLKDAMRKYSGTNIQCANRSG